MMNNGSTTIIQRRRNHEDLLAMLQHRQPNIHGKKLMLCIWWDQLGVVYYELLKPNETITGALCRTQLMKLSRALKKKRAHYYSRHDKIILHDNARSYVAAPVKTFLENQSQMGSSTPLAVFFKHCSFPLSLVPIDDAWPV